MRCLYDKEKNEALQKELSESAARYEIDRQRIFTERVALIKSPKIGDVIKIVHEYAYTGKWMKVESIGLSYEKFVLYGHLMKKDGTVSSISVQELVIHSLTKG